MRPPHTVNPSQGFTKVLNTGQLLRKVAAVASVGKRARDNAIARAALSQGSDQNIQMVRTAINYMQPSSQLTPDQFYKTIMETMFDWIATSPNGREVNRRVEIHHHHHGEAHHEIAPPPQPGSSQPIRSAEPQPDDVPRNEGFHRSTHRIEPQTRKKRIRIRFTTFPLRDVAPAPWQCPYSTADCPTCTRLWQRRYRCNKPSCHREHLHGAHVVLNRAEERFVRSQHPEYKIERAQREPSPLLSDGPPSPASDDGATASATADSVVDTTQEIANLTVGVVDIPPSPGKHTLDWASEVEEKRGRI